MKHDDDIIEPALPRDLLPPALPPADAASWALQREQLMTRLQPGLSALAVQEGAAWTTTLAAWWKPAAALAAAAMLLVVVSDMPAPTSPDALPLSVLAAQGDPVSLWEGLGADAHPVLALIVAQSAARAR